LLTDLQDMVNAGEDAFDAEAASTLAGGSMEFVQVLEGGECGGVLDS